MFHVLYFQITENLNMNSSEDDELPDIPGTRYPWMNIERDDEAGPSTASRRYV